MVPGFTPVLSGRSVATTPTVIFLTSGSSWTVPANWNGIGSSVECLGGGAGGAGGDQGGSGGGGGAYAMIPDLTLTPGATVSYAVGLGGGGGASDPDNSKTNGKPGGDTWFQATTTVLAKGGLCPTGGQASAGIGMTKYSGGNGVLATSDDRGYAAGGAAGRTGNGVNGSGSTGGAAGAGGGWTATSGATAAPGKGGNANAAGSLYGGGGGGGADDTNGKSGAQGIVVIRYYPFL